MPIVRRWSQVARHSTTNHSQPRHPDAGAIWPTASGVSGSVLVPSVGYSRQNLSLGALLLDNRPVCTYSTPSAGLDSVAVMTIPDYQSLMKPVLSVLADSDVLSMRELTDRIADRLSLTDEERRETITSGMSLIANRVHWSVTYLFKAKAVHRPQRGSVQITQRGRDLLTTDGEIRNATLEQFPEYREFYDKYRSNKSKSLTPEAILPSRGMTGMVDEADSPDDLIARAEADARSVLTVELLEKVRSIHPTAFEQLVLKLLGAMGYGGLGEHLHTGQSNDKGLDGIINEDKLGLDRIYVQAKRYGDGNAVTPEQIRGFLGAMMGKGDRGVFLTASTFTKGAREAAAGVPAHLALIDGEELVKLMIDHGVGVEPVRVATLHRINEDFFDAL